MTSTPKRQFRIRAIYYYYHPDRWALTEETLNNKESFGTLQGKSLLLVWLTWGTDWHAWAEGLADFSLPI